MNKKPRLIFSGAVLLYGLKSLKDFTPFSFEENVTAPISGNSRSSAILLPGFFQGETARQ